MAFIEVFRSGTTVGAGCFSGRVKPKYHTPRKPVSDYTEVSVGGVILKAKQGVD